jgi:hypothetical protein
MARHSSDKVIGSERTIHADYLVPSKGGTCARCGKFIAPILGALSNHDERTVALIRNGMTVSAIKFLHDETGCSLAVAKEMVEHMYGLTRRPLGPPCASCGALLRTPRAKLCAECGARVGQ